MSKRFTDTEIWDEDWFIALPRDYRDLWFYIKDKCDHAGIWRPNVTTFNKLFDCSVDLKKALELFNKDKERIVVVNGGRWFLSGFIPFQYGLTLNPNNRLHASILSLLEKNGVKLTLIRPQVEVKDTPKDRGLGVKDKDKDKKKDKVFSYSSFKETNNTEFKNKLKETYPEVNIELEFKKMGLWLQENPNKEYKNYGRFAGNWISRCARENEKGQAGKSKIRKIPPPPGGYQTGEKLSE